MYVSMQLRCVADLRMLQSIEAGDYSDSDRSVSELVEFLNSTSDTVLQEAENEDSERKAFQILTEIHRFTTSPSLNLVFF